MNLRKKIIKNSLYKTPSPKKAPNKRGCAFSINQSISNRRLSVFTNFSKQTKEKMSGLMLSINSICHSMCFGSQNKEAIQTVSSNAKAQTRRLSKTLEKIQAVNNAFNQDFMSYPYDVETRVKLIKKKATIKETDNVLSLSEISTANFQTKGNEREEEEITKRFKQMNQLHQLKGEIRLMDQKKKYSVKKTFNKTKVYFKQHFFRKEKDAIKYKSYLQYNKDDIYYKRSYKKYSTKNYSTYQNTINDTICSNNDKKDHQKIKSSRIFSPNDYKTNVKITHSTSNEKASYFKPINDFLSVTTGTNTSKDNNSHIRTYNTKSVPVLMRKKKDKGQPRFGLIQSINSKALLESNKLNQEVATLFIKEKEKKKSNRNNISLQGIRKEFKLDELSDTIDENKILCDNASKVMKNLDKQSQIILQKVVQEMIYKDDLLNRKYYDDSTYSKKLESINEKKEFQKVVDEMMALKKELKAEKAIVPVNEKEKMFKIVTDLEDQEWKNIDCLRHLKNKNHIMATIKPIIMQKKIKLKAKSPTNSIYGHYSNLFIN